MSGFLDFVGVGEDDIVAVVAVKREKFVLCF